MIRRLFLFAAVTLITTIAAFGQDDDIDAAMKKAMENANKPASKADMKKLEQQAKAQMDQMEAENKADEAKQKAAAQAVVDAKGPTTFPDWTPQVPQFTPSGPPARKLVDGEPKIIQTGTSSLSPEALCDAWDKFANPKFSHQRGGSEINHNADLSKQRGQRDGQVGSRAQSRCENNACDTFVASAGAIARNSRRVSDEECKRS